MRYRVTVRGPDIELRGLVDSNRTLTALSRALAQHMPSALIVASVSERQDGPLIDAWYSILDPDVPNGPEQT